MSGPKHTRNSMIQGLFQNPQVNICKPQHIRSLFFPISNGSLHKEIVECDLTFNIEEHLFEVL